MKLIDFDGLFDRKISEYIEKNPTKYTEEQWSDVIPRLYEKFGNTVLNTIHTTPNLYYSEMDAETLAATLAEHVKQNVPVSDFLCREMEKRSGEEAFLSLLKSDDEAIVTYAVNINGSNAKAYPYYLDMISGDKFSQDVKDAAADKIKENADPVKDELLSLFRQGIERDYMLDMISKIKTRDDAVYQLLLNEFLSNLDDIPMHASYLASYGDERALPYLFEQIKREDINYVEFQELKYAIETLGGEYNEERDFSDDEYYRQIHGESEGEVESVFDRALAGTAPENTEKK